MRNQKINYIIVRDLSRFAREHIGAEDYLNNIFPFLGVRFIAINDGYDNLNLDPQEYFMISFKNFAHAYFAQETSRKVSIAKRNLQEQGKFVGSKVSFGYKRNPDDKHSLIINEEEGREVLKKVIAAKIHQIIRTDMPCPAKSSAESVADPSKEDITIFLTAKAIMSGAVAVTWKISSPAP